MHTCNIPEEFYALAIGQSILNYVKEYDLHQLARQMDTEALLLLNEILAILDDTALDDPECFYRVDRLVRAFHRRGLVTSRQNELD